MSSYANASLYGCTNGELSLFSSGVASGRSFHVSCKCWRNRPLNPLPVLTTSKSKRTAPWPGLSPPSCLLFLKNSFKKSPFGETNKIFLPLLHTYT